MKEKKEIRVRVVQDIDSVDPREWDNLGHMVCWHREYALGDKHDYEDPSTFEAEVGKRRDVIMIPLYLLDHSGIYMNTYGFRHCDPHGWDWGQVGCIYCTYEEIKKEYGKITKKVKEQSRVALEREVEIYGMYLKGDVWGYVIEEKEQCAKCGHVEWNCIDSCFGFYGDIEEGGMLESIPLKYHKLIPSFDEYEYA